MAASVRCKESLGSLDGLGSRVFPRMPGKGGRSMVIMLPTALGSGDLPLTSPDDSSESVATSLTLSVVAFLGRLRLSGDRSVV